MVCWQDMYRTQHMSQMVEHQNGEQQTRKDCSAHVAEGQIFNGNVLMIQDGADEGSVQNIKEYILP